MNFPFEEKSEPESVGMSAKKLEKLVSILKQQRANGGFIGGQLVVRRKGKVVVNEAVVFSR